jgi:hypothetical protein
MTRWKLIVGFICCCCLLETGNAGMNDRTQKLLETQSLNARPSGKVPANGGSTTNSTTKSTTNINARPSYGPTHGVFDSPVINKGGATVSPRK